MLKRHPKLRVWLMHAGWPYLQETKALMYVYPQLHADVSVINWIIPRQEFHDYLQALMTAGLGDRLMFGSDQMAWPEAITLAVEGVDSAAFLTPAQKRAIFHDNAALPRAARHGSGRGWEGALSDARHCSEARLLARQPAVAGGPAELAVARDGTTRLTGAPVAEPATGGG